MSKRLMAALIVGGMTAIAAPAFASQPVALALDVSGSADPPLDPFSEIAPGQKLDLGSDGRIEFLHYVTCQTVTIEGGKVTFSDQNFTVQHGKVVDVKRAKCPTTVALNKEAQIGGIVLRSGDSDTLNMSRRPELVLVGAKRASYREIAVRHKGAVVLRTDLTGPRFSWPESADPLISNETYALELIAADGSGKSLEFVARKRRGSPPLTLIRAD